MSIFNFFTLFGGLALFLFGMDIMGKGLEKQAGNKLSLILEKLTSSPLKGFLLGLTVTAIIQSSSATTVMVVGFVNSGIMNLRQAVGVIMGSNVGTTVTSWLLSLTGIQGDSFFIKLLKPSSFAPILALIGIVLYMAAKSEKKKNFGTILLGFAILMTGMESMSGAVKPLSNVPEFTAIFTAFSNPLLGVAIGAILTAVLQSSSASVGILQALATTGAVTYSSALPIIMGQNIGTCVTAIISSVGANKNAKRAAAIHLYFNIIGAAVFMIGFYSLNSIFRFTFFSQSVSVAGIAVIHTLFNVVATAIMLPFTAQLEKLAKATIKDADQEEEFQLLDQRLLATPALAVERSKKLMDDMAALSLDGFCTSVNMLDHFDEKVCADILKMEKTVDKYEDKLGSYLVQLSEQDLRVDDSREISKILHLLGDFERISDHSVNLVTVSRELKDKDIQFSSQAMAELSVLKAAVIDLINNTRIAYKTQNNQDAQKVEPLQQCIDELIRELKTNHIERLKNKSCTIELGFVLSDLLTNYERVADHCSNIALAILQAKTDAFAPHEYLRNFRKEEQFGYQQLLDQARQQYHFAKSETL